MIDHLRAENVYTDAVMAPAAALTETLFAEIKSRIKETDLSVPVVKDGWAYYSRTEEGLAYPIHCRRPARPGQSPAEIDLDDREAEVLGDRVKAVIGEELGGRDAEAPGEVQHVDGGEDDVDVGTAPIEAGDARMAGEGEVVLLGDLALVLESFGKFGRGVGHSRGPLVRSR